MSGKERKPKKVVEELKICVRKLPPNLGQDVFMKSIANYKDIIVNFYFVQGKNKEKYAKFGRAYITFKTTFDKNNFLKDYRPLFIDEKGNKYMAKVETSLYQKDAKNIKANPNPNDGTYKDSEEFQAFLERLKNPKQATVNSDDLKRRPSLVEEASPRKPGKTALIQDIERRLNEKRAEKDAKRRKEKEKETKYAPKTVIVYQKKEK